MEYINLSHRDETGYLSVINISRDNCSKSEKCGCSNDKTENRLQYAYECNCNNNPHCERAGDCLCRNSVDRAQSVAFAHSLITSINSISLTFSNKITSNH